MSEDDYLKGLRFKRLKGLKGKLAAFDAEHVDLHERVKQLKEAYPKLTESEATFLVFCGEVIL